MLRIAAPDKKRLLQTLPGNLVATYGGGEANVCASLGVLGMPVRYLTALPDNPVASAAIAELRKLNMAEFFNRVHFDRAPAKGYYPYPAAG